MTGNPSAYGLWSLVLLNAAVFIIFAFSFYKPKTSRDWRSFGMYAAFIVALFSEMYGFPLTIYLLSGWLSQRFPEVDFLSHDAGHLLEVMFGWRANPHFGPFHLLSTAFIFGGFWLLASAWNVLYQAQRAHRVAASGPYARIRHPQYAAFVLIMFGFLLQWPTIITVVMFPILVIVYTRLARREEAEALKVFGNDYQDYLSRTPAFVPRFNADTAQGKSSWITPIIRTRNTATAIQQLFPQQTRIRCAA
ncbi:MAG: isoprenylcysteine carboxylmethyltransferase family protein [Sulfuritalea sp.]|nr:isoprenylcysteine carboxylmethyltransferase family protein [Sulfuritalea sp.]